MKEEMLADIFSDVTLKQLFKNHQRIFVDEEF